MIISNESRDNIGATIYYDDGSNQEIKFSSYDKYYKWIESMQSDEHVEKIVTLIERTKRPSIKFTDISAGDFYIDKKSYSKYDQISYCQYGLNFYIAFQDGIQPVMYTILLQVMNGKIFTGNNPNIADITIKRYYGEKEYDMLTLPIYAKISSKEEYDKYWNKDTILNICVNQAQEFIDYVLSATHFPIGEYAYI